MDFWKKKKIRRRGEVALGLRSREKIESAPVLSVILNRESAPT